MPPALHASLLKTKLNSSEEKFRFEGETPEPIDYLGISTSGYLQQFFTVKSKM